MRRFCWSHRYSRITVPFACFSYRRFPVASYSNVLLVPVVVTEYVFVVVLFCPSFASTTTVFAPASSSTVASNRYGAPPSFETTFAA